MDYDCEDEFADWLVVPCGEVIEASLGSDVSEDSSSDFEFIDEKEIEVKDDHLNLIDPQELLLKSTDEVQESQKEVNDVQCEVTKDEPKNVLQETLVEDHFSEVNLSDDKFYDYEVESLLEDDDVKTFFDEPRFSKWDSIPQKKHCRHQGHVFTRWKKRNSAGKKVYSCNISTNYS